MKKIPTIVVWLAFFPTFAWGQIVKVQEGSRISFNGVMQRDYISVAVYDVSSREEIDPAKKIRLSNARLTLVVDQDTTRYNAEGNGFNFQKKIKDKTFQMIVEREGYVTLIDTLEVHDHFWMMFHAYLTPVAPGKEEDKN